MIESSDVLLNRLNDLVKAFNYSISAKGEKK